MSLQGSYRYAEGKWTIKEVLMHIIDTERVFSYRGLAAARGDASPHYRMDEELYAKNVDVSHRSLQSNKKQRAKPVGLAPGRSVHPIDSPASRAPN